VENGFLALHDQGMACIIAALEADNNISFVGEKVNDFALAFVTPLRAYDRDVCHLTSGVRHE
jgi:hypothetical protein